MPGLGCELTSPGAKALVPVLFQPQAQPCSTAILGRYKTVRLRPLSLRYKVISTPRITHSLRTPHTSHTQCMCTPNITYIPHVHTPHIPTSSTYPHYPLLYTPHIHTPYIAHPPHLPQIHINITHTPLLTPILYVHTPPTIYTQYTPYTHSTHITHTPST